MPFFLKSSVQSIFFYHAFILQFSSVTQLCPTLCDPMNCSTPGFPVHHQLLELAQTCPSSQWCHPTISSSVVPFSSRLQSFPASGSFPMSQFFTSSGQSIEASASVLPMNIQDWFPLGLTVRSPCSPRDSQESSPTPQFKSINSLALNFPYGPTLKSIHDYLLEIKRKPLTHNSVNPWSGWSNLEGLRRW